MKTQGDLREFKISERRLLRVEKFKVFFPHKTSASEPSRPLGHIVEKDLFLNGSLKKKIRRT